jgi:hypothetical protein
LIDEAQCSPSILSVSEPVGRESEAHPAFSIYFGQKFPAAFRSVIEKKERAARNKGANILRHKLGRTRLPKAGCVSLSRPTAKKYMVNLQIIFIKKPPVAAHCYISSTRTQ